MSEVEVCGGLVNIGGGRGSEEIEDVGDAIPNGKSSSPLYDETNRRARFRRCAQRLPRGQEV